MPHSLDTLADLVASLSQNAERNAIIAFARDGKQTLTYAALAAAARRAAVVLRERGVESGERIALLGPNSPDWIVVYFGIVTAGAVAVPLDPQNTAQSTAAAIAHAGATALITTRAQQEGLAALTEAGVRIWEFHDTAEGGVDTLGIDSRSTDLPLVTGKDIASLLFTSGTTGNPKAVPLTHANLAANVRELVAAQLIAADDRVLLPLPLHHTYPFTVGLLTTLATGATLVLPAGISGPEIREACGAGRATALLAVPRLCTAIWDGVQAAVRARGPTATRAFGALLSLSIALRRYTGIRIGRRLFGSVHARFGGALALIGCGGAKLESELAWNLEGLGFRVLTGYGLTETSPVLTFNSPRHSRLGSEGRPLPSAEVRIAGSGSDASGEILARGASVFTGYWNGADATAAAFTEDGWFRTGDLGHFDDAGFLHVVGRRKELVVLADGKKFFPEVVEQPYAESALLREIAVFERGGLLAAVVVPDEDEIRVRGALSEASMLRDEIERVASQLPPHYRITSYRAVREPLPRTQLGKVKRHLLPGLFDGAAETSSVQTEPMTAEDRDLLADATANAVWDWLKERYPERKLTLGTSPQLDLSIDSLAWVALTVEIERRFHVALRAEQLACILTLRDLLREVQAAAQAGNAAGPKVAAFVPPSTALRALGAAVFGLVRPIARIGLRPMVTGVEHLPAGPALIAPNHASYLDPLALAVALPWQRLRRTYWAGWVGVMHTSALRRTVSRATQVFPVDPDRDLAAAVRTARELLAEGYDVVWFPEGRRSLTGQLQQFRPGVGMLLDGTNVPVVPVAITGTFAAWPAHRRWPRPAHVRVQFGPPLDVGQRSPGTTPALIEDAVRTLLAAESEPAP